MYTRDSYIQKNRSSGLNKTAAPRQNYTRVQPITIQTKSRCSCGGTCPKCLTEQGVQPKLTIGQPDDKYEQEADHVADQVMRMPEPAIQRESMAEEDLQEADEQIQTKPLANTITPLVQRQNNEDDEEVISQMKPRDGSPSPTAAIGSKIHSLQGRGQPLPVSSRSFFEPRIGADFSNVRIHTDAAAGQLASSVNARAFTVGNHVVFGRGEYSPGSQSGKMLLAHELTHVLQQSGKEQQIQRFVNCGSDCPERPREELDRHRTASFQILPLPAPENGILISGFGIGSAATPDLATNADFIRISTSIAASSHRYEIRGFTDCQGTEDRNESLRLARATAVHSILPAGAQARIDSVDAASMSDCISDNSDEPARTRNRAVAIITTETRYDFPEEAITGTPCPPRTSTGARDLSEYVALIQCAETTTGWTPRNMLAMLRQMYYGKPWSATSTTNRWDNVIPCSPNIGNPRLALGHTLFDSLHNSVVVAGVDVGHVFTGLEAMTCPSTSVPFFAGLASVSIPNEEFATFTGDLGATAAANVACNELGTSAVSEEACGFTAAPQNLAFYFNVHAPQEDLEGDIDPFVMRAGELGIPCNASLGRTITISRPISEIFHEYYNAPTSTLGTLRPDRYRCILTALGAHISGNRITNRAAVHAALQPRVMEFARAFYHGIRGVLVLPGVGGTLGMLRDSHTVTDWFLTYLENRL